MILSYITLIYFIVRAPFIGITFNMLKNNVYQDLWISMIISILIGFIYIFILKYISRFKEELNIIDKINLLFPKLKYLIHTILVIIITLLIIINYWNLMNLVTSQFLNKTPKLIIGITFLIPLIYISNQKDIIIPRVSLMLFYISFILYIVSAIGLINRVNYINLLPILENNTIKGIPYYLTYNVLPIFMILIYPNDKINKNILIGYLVASISILIVGILIIAILGINLTLLYRYSEFHILKFAYESMINYRLENLLTIQWIFDIFIFISIGIKYISKTINTKYLSLIPIILFILSIYVIPSIFEFNAIIKILPYMLIPFSIIILLIMYKIKTYE